MKHEELLKEIWDLEQSARCGTPDPQQVLKLTAQLREALQAKEGAEALSDALLRKAGVLGRRDITVIRRTRKLGKQNH